MRTLFITILIALPAFSWADNSLPLDYPASVKPIVEQRCMVCHGCYDAPCQLKMDDWLGLQRGASKEKVYDGSRLRPASLTRLYEDALSEAQWRDKGFYPVLNPKNNEPGVFHRMLELKSAHPLPTEGPLPPGFDLRLDRDQSCPKPGEMDRYASERPYQGMPYGLPGLNQERLGILSSWLEGGAEGVEVPARSAAEQRAIDEWEAFFNGADKKSRLASRYIYEHLFIGDLHFDHLDAPSGWYKLVRSRTPPGQPVDIIATRRPYDDPGADTFYYRLQQRYTARLAKRHMPYALNPERMARWTQLFLEPDYKVEKLPGYKGDNNANPFIVFEPLPVSARYRFMLEEAQFTIMGFIKGPVCRGQVALNVIDDHFWVAFARPNPRDPEQQADFLAAEAKHMRLPQARGSLVVTLVQWHQYAKDQQRYLRAEAKKIAEVVDQSDVKLDMNLIWDGGEERNDNAALTVFRHFDSASVVKGLVGQKPKTMWVIDYSLLERIHYLLVAGFDVYGPVGHQLESRLYMDFLRMEGEQNFLMLLPMAQREAQVNYWYRDSSERVRKFLLPPRLNEYQRETSIQYNGGDAKEELMDMFFDRISTAINDRYTVNIAAMESLMEEPDHSFSFFPEVAFLQVIRKNGEREAYSLLHNRAHSNIAQLFGEESRFIPEEDTLTVTPGFIGTYPNIFFQVNEIELDAFAKRLSALANEEDYTELVDRYGVRRTAPWFWRTSDYFVEQYRTDYPVEAGLFDLNRYENR